MLINAYINHGRWVADCPRCNSAQIIASSNPYFACGCGFNAGVQFPAELERIEAVLALRPEDVNRNWRAPETLADLRIENAVHGVGS